MKAHCLFEQSGTFKNEFKKLGINAMDYDIRNDFSQTDYIVDLFEEIRGGYEGRSSIFDNIEKDDLIVAFFPCVRFANQTMLWFRGQNYAQRNWSVEKKMEYDMKLNEELNEMYQLVNKMFIVCMRKGLKLIMENPYSQEHYLRRYWCYLPGVIDMDRRERGDYFKKPTQYWFLNCEPMNNLIVEEAQDNFVDKKNAIVNTSNRVKRSMIHPDYANRFIREFIL